MEKKIVKISLSEEDLEKINGGISVSKETSMGIFYICRPVSTALAGKNDPGGNEDVLSIKK